MRISDWSSDVCSSDLVFTASAPTAQTSSVFCVRSKPSRVRRMFNLAFCAGLNEPLFQPAFIPHITAYCLFAAFSALSSFCLGVQIIIFAFAIMVLHPEICFLAFCAFVLLIPFFSNKLCQRPL